MKRGMHGGIAVATCAVWLLAVPIATAQGSAAEPAQSSPAQTAAALTPAQLDQLVAPIALYPDTLLGEILTASTYPLEIVLAARWLEEPGHSQLTGDALTDALRQQDWDSSVQALVAVPEVLRMMDRQLQWTESLGNAFLSQQSDVMDSIQRLRQRAAASGALQSGSQQSVTNEDDQIVIEPVNADVIYVPCYSPIVYGPWPWPDYPAFYFPPPPGFCYGGPLISFGIGFDIFGPYWGGYRWNWRGHGLYTGAHGPGRPWRFNPGHRRGVPYPSAAIARRYGGANVQSWRNYRGFPSIQAQRPAPRTAPREPARPRPAASPKTRTAPPMFESYGSGSSVRSESSRGASSRASHAGAGGGFGGARGGGGHGGGGPRR
jgi:uncharacterized membrane protein YgcG